MPRNHPPSGIHHLMEAGHARTMFAAAALLLAGCSDDASIGTPSGNVDMTTGTPGTTGTGTGTTVGSGTDGGSTSGGVGTTTTGAATTTTGVATTTTGGVDGGTTTGAGGAMGMGGTSSTTTTDGMGGTSSTTTTDSGTGGTLGGFGGGGDGTIGEYTLDCGSEGVAIESHGPPSNRVNYIFVGEGYDSSEIETTFLDHINGIMDRRFNHESGEPFGRYRKFVNICAIKSAGTGQVGSPFNGATTGDRTASINENAVDQYLNDVLPMDLEADWVSASFNISSWNNVGGRVVLFAGGNQDAAGAELHEAGHGHHQLADEYGTCTGAGCGEDTSGTGPTGTEYGEIDMTGNPMTTAGKWDRWIGVVQKGLKSPDEGATGLQSTWSGGRYESPTSGQYRPSDNSMMNSLFGLNVNTSFNSISREQIIYTIWEHVKPIDEVNPPAGAVSGAQTLQVLVIDPAVINVDWYVDDALVAENGGTAFDLAASGLGAGSYTIKATAHDNATEDLVRYRDGECPQGVTQRYCHSAGWLNSTESVEWTVTL